jgi:hypothetical protein
MLNGIEKELLKKFNERLVLRREEILKFLAGKVRDPNSMLKIVTNSLISKGLIRYVYSGESCYAITQKGMQALE